MTRVDLPWTSPPLSANDRGPTAGHRARKVADALAEARWAIRAAKPAPWPIPVVVTTHYRPADHRNRDADNLASTHKVIQDALVAEGVLPNGDGWRWVRRAAQEIHEPTGEPAAMWVTVDPWRATA